MSKTVIEVSDLSKMYDLGLVGTGTLSKDLNRFWAKMRGKPDPYATLAEINDRTKQSFSNTVLALKDINFKVEQGEVLGIIGRNGAGKSTLLKILSQITSPTSGDIKIKGRVASLLEVGTGMHPEMTARQNIYLNGAIMGMTRKEISSKLEEIIDFAGIIKYIDTPIKRFSSGMQVRLGFAVAAFLEPEILIVDEVLAVGDAEFQKRAVGKMKEVSKGEGRTVLFVSHNMASVKSLCTRGILMNNGEIELQGAVDDVLNSYARRNVSITAEAFIKTSLFSVESFKIQGVTPTGKERDTIDEFDKVIIDTTVDVLTDIGLRLTYVLSNADGITLFTFTESGNYLNWGKYKVVCEIPYGFLNIGQYYLSLFIIDKHLKTVHREDNIGVFNVDYGQRPLGSWMGVEPGFIKPTFNWKFEVLNEA